MSKQVVIGTRGSKLALWQANDLKDKLLSNNISAELKIIKTKGDRIQDLSFDKIEGKGFFTKEIEEELIGKKIDVAVHSLKDLPTDQPSGLVLAGLSDRQDPSDLLIINPDAYEAGQDLGLKNNAVIGTSSIRRQTQIRSILPHVEINDLRGNVPTRIDKLRTGNYDAIILASAGINRLEIDLSEFKTVRLNPKEFVPAPGQGVIAYQCREEDIEMRKILSKVHSKETSARTNIERTVLNMMDGGCHIPLGVYTDIDDAGNYHTYAAYSKGDNQPLKKINLSQSTSHELADKIVIELKKD